MNDKEFILCAANWYPNFPLIMPDLPMFKPDNITEGIVICGHRHHNCIYIMCAITGKMQHEINGEEQGFLTSKNRFVSREEALKIAFECKQITKSLNDRILFSEDLY